MKSRIAGILIILMLPLAACAQQAEDDGPRRGPGRDGPGRGRMGPGGAGRGGPRGPGGPGGFFNRGFERMARYLELDDEQRAAIEEITAPGREQMRSMGEQWREYQEARRSGDEARAAELRANLPDRGRMGEIIEQMMTDVEPVLREDQRIKFNEMRTEMQQRRSQRERWRQVTQELPDTLGLDQDQRDMFDELLQQQRHNRRERMREMRPLFEEMRAAREAGDDVLADELAAELRASRPDPNQMMDQFIESVAGFLREDQLPALNAFLGNVETGMPTEAEAKEETTPADLRSVLRAARRVRLTSEQRAAIKKIEEDAMKQSRKAGRRDKDAQADIAVETKAKIEKLLKPDQVETFKKALKRAARSRR